jgi:hypothetical protein
MRVKLLLIAMMAVVSIVASHAAAQGVVRLVPDEPQYVLREADQPSPSDLVVSPPLANDLKDESWQKDNGIWKDGGSAGCCEPLWSVYAGAVVLRRDNPSIALFDTGFRAGVDIDVRRRLGERYELQFRYFGVDGWSDQVTETVIVDEAPEIDLFGYYANQLYSAELNLRRCWTDRVTVLAGFRWVELQEQGLFEAEDSSSGGRTYNHMYGFQLGTDLLVWDRGGPFTVNAELKAGVYSNLAKSSAFGEEPDNGSFAADGRKYHTAFLGDLAIKAKYQLNNNWAVLAGYQLLWFEGVALANDNQLTALAEGDVDTSGSPFYHGALLGAEYRW